MTTLVAMHCPGRGTWIGADQQVSQGSMGFGPVQKWVVHSSGWAAAAAGPYSAITIMEEASDKLFRSLRTPYQFMDRLRRLLHSGGFMPSAEEPGPVVWANMEVMLANPEGLWSFDATLGSHQVQPNTLWAAGSGREFAFGAGRALLQANPDMDPLSVVVGSLETAISFDNNSGFGPWIGHLNPPTKRPSRSRSR